jgi:hypothetical protein
MNEWIRYIHDWTNERARSSSERFMGLAKRTKKTQKNNALALKTIELRAIKSE